MNKYMSKLGLKVKDSVTGFKGIVTSIGFDLYGCVQCVVTPVLDKKAKKQEPEDSRWFDEKLLVVMDPKPVMPVPSFDFDDGVLGVPGPENKPRRSDTPRA